MGNYTRGKLSQALSNWWVVAGGGGAEEAVQYEDRRRRNSGTFTNPHPALLRAASPRSELATAGNTHSPLLALYFAMSAVLCPSACSSTVRLLYPPSLFRSRYVRRFMFFVESLDLFYFYWFPLFPSKFILSSSGCFIFVLQLPYISFVVVRCWFSVYFASLRAECRIN